MHVWMCVGEGFVSDEKGGFMFFFLWIIVGFLCFLFCPCGSSSVLVLV